MTRQSLYDSFLFCRGEMSARFSLAELEDLCWEMGVDPDEVPHETPLRLATGMLRWADRRDQRTRLLGLLNNDRPNVDWPADYSCNPKHEAEEIYSAPSQTFPATASSASPTTGSLSAGDFYETQAYPSRLSTQARLDLCAFLARLPEFESSTGRSGFIGMTLPHLKGAIIFDGSPRVFASTMLTVAEQSGFVPPDEEYHCLGAILYYILSDPAVPETDKRFCASLIVQHKLVRSDSILAELRDRYRLDVEVATKLVSPTAPSQNSELAPVPNDALVEGIMKALKHGPREQPYQLKIDTVGGSIRRFIIEVGEK